MESETVESEGRMKESQNTGTSQENDKKKIESIENLLVFNSQTRPATLRKRFCMVLTCAFIHVVPCNPMCAKVCNKT